MDKKIKLDSESIDISGGVTFSELTNRYSEKVNELFAKYDNVHNIYVECESHEYNDGKNYAQEIIIYYNRYETDEEYHKRIDWLNYRKKEQEVCDIKKMKELISNYTNIAMDYINEINKN
jgi:hypothetical protein